MSGIVLVVVVAGGTCVDSDSVDDTVEVKSELVDKTIYSNDALSLPGVAITLLLSSMISLLTFP